MSYGNDKPTPSMTEAERAARIDELERLMRWISTEDDWCTILSRASLRRARLKAGNENETLTPPKMPTIEFTSDPGHLVEFDFKGFMPLGEDTQ